MPTVNEMLRDGIVRHQIGLIRVSNGMRSQVVNHLNRTEADLRAQIITRTSGLANGRRDGLLLTPTARKRLAALERAVGAARGPGFEQLHTTMRDGLTEIALEEPKFLEGLVKGLAPVELPLKNPTPSEIRKVVTSRPFQGRILRDWAKTLEFDDRRRIMNEIRIGLTQGQGVRDIAARIVGTAELNGSDGVTQITRTQAETLVRTAISHIGSAARREFTIANRAFFTKEEWVAILDNRTSDICLNLDGKLFKLGVGIYPPAHFNALAEGTLITTSKGEVPIERVEVGQRVLTHRGRMMPVTAVMAKPSDVETILRVETSTGNIILATDEHPMLAMGRGWIRTDEIQIGDKLFQYGEQKSGLKGQSCVVSHANDYPAPFNESLVAYQVLTEPGSMATAINFDSDQMTAKSEINRTSLNNELVDDIDESEQAHFLKNVPQRFFGFGDTFAAPFPGLGFPYGVIDVRVARRIGTAQHALAMALIQLSRALGILPLPGIFAPGSVDVGLASCEAIALAANFNPGRLAEIRDFPRRDAEFFGDMPERSALAPMLSGDEISQGRQVEHWAVSYVVSISRIPYHAHVYNLAVGQDETYVASDIIVHNCRSSRVPYIGPREAVRQKLLPSEQRRLLKEFVKDKGLDRRVRSRGQLSRSEKSAFDKFARNEVRKAVGGVPLNRLKAEDFIEAMNMSERADLLGVTKARLVAKGGLSIGQLVDRHGLPLTLRELAIRERAAFNRANLDPGQFSQ